MKSLTVLVCLLMMSGVVTNTEVAISGDYVVVAVITSPIYSKVESDAIIAEVTDEYQYNYPGKIIIVTRDVTVYYGLKRARLTDNIEMLEYYVNKAKKSYDTVNLLAFCAY